MKGIYRVLVLAVSVALLCSATKATAAPNDRYGLVTQVFNAQEDQKVTELGVGWVRLSINWPEVQPGSSNDWYWGDVTSRINAARAHNLKIYATIAYTPSWAGPCAACAPTNLAAWTTFVGAVIWNCRGDDIVFGIWNEPNLSAFLNDDSVGNKYKNIFAAADAARAVYYANGIPVPFGAPETSHHAVTSSSYFSSVMAKIAPYRRYGDVISVHYYTDSPLTLAQYMSNITWRGPTWLTETGVKSPENCNEFYRSYYQLQTATAFENTAASQPNLQKIFHHQLGGGNAICDRMVNDDGSERQVLRDLRATIAVYEGNRMYANDALYPEQSRYSPDGRFYLKYQSDGNLVVYRASDGQWLWASWTQGTSAGITVMQSDGNLVVYDADGVPVWNAQTWGNDWAWLSVGDDGQLHIYDGFYNSQIWQSGPGGY